MKYLVLLLSWLSIIKLNTSNIIIQKRWAYLNITAVSKADSGIVKTNLLADAALYGTNSPSYQVFGRLVAAISFSSPSSMDDVLTNGSSTSN